MKRLYKIVAVVAVVAATGMTAYNNAQNDELQMSSLAMANIEALASEELGAGVCHGTGIGYCPGGYTICCWAHTHVYGKD